MQGRMNQRGFTLLELMVVMVIIGVLIAAALLSTSFTNMDRKLEEEGRRFSALLRYAREEAILQTRDLGLQIGENDFRFLMLDPLTNRWVTAEFDPVLRGRQFPDDIRATLWIEGAGFELGNPDEPVPDPGELPQIFVLSSGEVSPFELLLESDAATTRVTVTAQLDGKTEILANDPGF